MPRPVNITLRGAVSPDRFRSRHQRESSDQFFYRRCLGNGVPINQ